MDRLLAAEIFVAIVERGSLTAAAEALDLSRAMITRGLAQMEAWSSARLLHRSTRRLSLTPAGEALLPRCRQLLQIAQEMAGGDDDPEPKGTLHVACSQMLAQQVLGAAIAEFLRRYPRTAVDLVADGRSVNLVESRIDLAVRITNELDPQLIARPLGLCESVVCAAPSYLAAHGCPERPQDLGQHNCLTYAHFGKQPWWFTALGSHEPASVWVTGNLRSNSSMTLVAAAEAGAGVALLPLLAVAPLLEKGRLLRLLPDYTPRQLGIYGVYTSRQRMPATLRAMLDFLVEWFASSVNR